MIYFGYEPPEEYDFRISFTVVKEVDCVIQLCSCAGHQFGFCLGTDFGRTADIEALNGGRAPGAVKMKDHWLVSGQHYTSVVKVRRTGIDAYVDGKPVVGVKTDYSNMDIGAFWKLPRGNVVGVGTFRNTIQLDSVEITEITGEGKLLSSK